MFATQAVHLLLFSERGFSFGVSAGQVKELVSADFRVRAADEHRYPERTVPYKGRELHVVQLSHRLKLQEALENNRQFLYRQDPAAEGDAGTIEDGGTDGLEPFSRILVVRHRHEGELGVHVEFLKELSLVPLAQIVRLPPIMEMKKQLQSVWGLALIDGRSVVLVDLERI